MQFTRPARMKIVGTKQRVMDLYVLFAIGHLSRSGAEPLQEIHFIYSS
jgi:hypothetical protein